MSQPKNIGAFKAALAIPHESLAVSSVEDSISMATHVVATLDSRIAIEVTKATINYMAEKTGLSPQMFRVFLEFLGTDPEIQDRFLAYTAARRILNDKPY